MLAKISFLLLNEVKENSEFDTFFDIVDALDVTANDLLEDTIKNGYKAKASRLSNLLEALSP